MKIELTENKETASIRVASPVDARRKRLTTRRQGSWRWQSRWGLSTYAPLRRADGEWTWQSVERSGHYSLPQAARARSGGYLSYEGSYSVRGEKANIAAQIEEIYADDSH